MLSQYHCLSIRNEILPNNEIFVLMIYKKIITNSVSEMLLLTERDVTIENTMEIAPKTVQDCINVDVELQ
jgi:hypothetical protein